MKKHMLLTILTVTILIFGSVAASHAEIIPAYGEGQIGLQAVVLCDTLTLRAEPSTSSKALRTLQYRDLINVTEQKDGWARCVLGDAEDLVVLRYALFQNSASACSTPRVPMELDDILNRFAEDLFDEAFFQGI